MKLISWNFHFQWRTTLIFRGWPVRSALNDLYNWPPGRILTLYWCRNPQLFSLCHSLFETFHPWVLGHDFRPELLFIYISYRKFLTWYWCNTLYLHRIMATKSKLDSSKENRPSFCHQTVLLRGKSRPTALWYSTCRSFSLLTQKSLFPEDLCAHSSTQSNSFSIRPRRQNLSFLWTFSP